MEKSLAGELARLEIPDLLTFLNLSRRGGVLLLDRLEQQTSIYFRGGQPIFANSNKEGLRLPDLLVRLGKLRADGFGWTGPPCAPILAAEVHTNRHVRFTPQCVFRSGASAQTAEAGLTPSQAQGDA